MEQYRIMVEQYEVIEVVANSEADAIAQCAAKWDPRVLVRFTLVQDLEPHIKGTEAQPIKYRRNNYDRDLYTAYRWALV